MQSSQTVVFAFGATVPERTQPVSPDRLKQNAHKGDLNFSNAYVNYLPTPQFGHTDEPLVEAKVPGSQPTQEGWPDAA